MTIEIVPATLAHAEALAPHMRPADAAEVLATSGRTPIEALRRALEFSEASWAALVDGEVMAIWGVAPVAILGGVGTVWALTSDAVDRHPKTFMRLAREAMPELLRRWPHLVNSVDARYGAALRWVQRLGFTVEEAQPYGAAGLPFHRITLEAHA